MRNFVFIAPSRSGHTWVLKLLRLWLHRDIVHDFEAIPPIIYNERVGINVWHGGPPKSGQPVIAVLNIRDYLNFAASWIKHLVNINNPRITPGLDIWYQITREALGDTDLIHDPKIIISYDRMVADRKYRQSVCYQLGGEYREEGIARVPDGSPGSSFDKFKYQDRGREMMVLDRWRWFLTDEGKEYIPCLRERGDILEYYLTHFEPDGEKRELTKYILK